MSKPLNLKTSLKHRGAALADPHQQLVALRPKPAQSPFEHKIAGSGYDRLSASSIEILQVNLGKLCNMTCVHCHVDAGPDRREIMDLETIQTCLEVLEKHPEIKTLDLTGGAPEMNPHFRQIVHAARSLGRHVIDRCNLSILLAKGFQDLPEFLAQHEVEIVASLPCYLEDNTDAQRGDGAFAASIEALRILNDLGYGDADRSRMLTLVYNPVGNSLPPNQQQLEEAYRRELGTRYNIRFNRLFTITNMPVSRYLDHLIHTNQLDPYMQTLIDAFNPSAINGLMCRNTLSVGWDGRLFDCDFNQMLDMQVADDCPKTIQEFSLAALRHRRIAIGQHCFGCTAGAGSGCQGATA